MFIDGAMVMCVILFIVVVGSWWGGCGLVCYGWLGDVVLFCVSMCYDIHEVSWVDGWWVVS